MRTTHKEVQHLLQRMEQKGLAQSKWIDGELKWSLTENARALCARR